VDFLTKEETEWVVKVGGGYDVIVSYLVEDAKELYDKLERVHAKFEKHILKKEISEVLSVPHFPKNYLLSVKSLARPYDFEQGDVVAIDSKDELLLKTIANNARMSLVDLAKELSLSPRGAMLRMKKLEKVGVVLNYRVALNIHKLGWIFTKAYFSLRHLDTSSFRSIKEYCNKSPYVIHVIQCVGRWDLEIDFEIPSYKHFYDFMLDFRTTFSGLIREFDYSIIMEDVKLDYYPGAKTAIVSKN
jgi:Lrp/AsnC family leucine-responsive transcriptional regulator